jgi:type II secretory pathway pseudopilin PulG
LTVVELLVVIFVVALLLALALPTFSHVRRSARDTRSAANCRQLTTVITTYADSHSGRFPIPGPGQLVPALSDAILIGYPYWDFHRTWSGVLYADLPYDKNLETYLTPHSRRSRQSGEAWTSSYTFTLTAGAPPDLWSPSAQQAQIPQKIMRVDDVLFPSNKGVLWEVEDFRRGVNEDVSEAVPIAFMDVSVRQLVPLRASEPVPNTTNSTGYANARIHNTAYGLHGKDY